MGRMIKLAHKVTTSSKIDKVGQTWTISRIMNVDFFSRLSCQDHANESQSTYPPTLQLDTAMMLETFLRPKGTSSGIIGFAGCAVIFTFTSLTHVIADTFSFACCSNCSRQSQHNQHFEEHKGPNGLLPNFQMISKFKIARSMSKHTCLD